MMLHSFGLALVGMIGQSITVCACDKAHRFHLKAASVRCAELCNTRARIYDDVFGRYRAGSPDRYKEDFKKKKKR